MEEQILVLPTPRFHDIGHFQGFSGNMEKYLAPLLECEDLSFQPRSTMEEDPGFKQLIPYVLMRYRAPSGEVQVFEYLRGGGQGEKRLHAKRSVGIGGHISSVDERDTQAANTYRQGMLRELEEEVHIGTKYEETCVGLINDDETSVGRVHLGVVHIFDVEEPKVSPREDEMLECGFRPVTDILTRLDEFESWSQIAVRALFA